MSESAPSMSRAAMPRKDLLAYATLAIVMLLWAGNSIIGRAVRHDIPPFTLAFVRWAGALLVVLPFAARHVVADRRRVLQGWKPILLIGLTGLVSFNALLYLGLRETTATNGLLLQAAVPALVLLFDFLFFRTEPSRPAMFGVALSTLGVAVIVFRADPAAILAFRFGRGDLLVLGAVVAWALYTISLRLRPAIDGLSLLAVTFALAALVMAPLAATEWREIAVIPWTAVVVGAFAYVAVLPSVVAYLFYNAAVARLGPARAGQAITLLPLFGALLATLLLGERLHGFHLAGMALILGGIAMTALLRSRGGEAG